MPLHPSLAALIAQVISTWADTELQFAKLLAALLKAEMPVGVSMYFALSGAEARRAALDAAAQKSLPPDVFELYERVMKVIRPIRKRRNDMVHGLWGYSNDLPDALLWMSADNFLKRDIAKHEARRAGDRKKVEAIRKSQPPEIIVYRARDLNADVKRAGQATTLVKNLIGCVRPPGPKHDAARQRLLASPLL